ncbi:hypothetical protein [Pseudonocardia asaccharolytica]|uniref:Uncharacterized protein n=1 Tax=Pseudonocardia asaccharolytica DSM 44247 = NBRC 16224 TaxID=1123024 RepID=A0A511D7W3_9PSEU|nr:hypothetical protein [Pseudonocardia asaccharolytica]GEL20852.1 hypothetical protein PA7_46890 [Pseudonocardia asaccharolytica DSM 44247 = NBRC 16224]
MRVKPGAIRDAVLLIGGLALLGYETVIAAEPRIAILTIAAAMIGLPATVLADRKLISRNTTPSESDPSPGPPSGRPPR